MSSLDEWSWRAIYARDRKKPPQSETAEGQPQPRARRIL